MASQDSGIMLDLVTPQARILSETVGMVVVPAKHGDVGIMANHAPLVCMLRAGLVDVYRLSEEVVSYFVIGGYMNISDNKCTIIAESLTPVASLSAQDVVEELQALRKALAEAETDDEATSINTKIIDAEAKLLAAEQSADAA